MCVEQIVPIWHSVSFCLVSNWRVLTQAISFIRTSIQTLHILLALHDVHCSHDTIWHNDRPFAMLCVSFRRLRSPSHVNPLRMLSSLCYTLDKSSELWMIFPYSRTFCSGVVCISSYLATQCVHLMVVIFERRIVFAFSRANDCSVTMFLSHWHNFDLHSKQWHVYPVTWHNIICIDPSTCIIL